MKHKKGRGQPIGWKDGPERPKLAEHVLLAWQPGPGEQLCPELRKIVWEARQQMKWRPAEPYKPQIGP